jgi:hypothetical protein
MEKGVAHASRVLAIASRNRRLCITIKSRSIYRFSREVRFGVTLKPTRETRALPGSLRSPESLRGGHEIKDRALKSALIIAERTQNDCYGC